MLKKFIYVFLFTGSLLYSEVMTTDRENYTTEQQIIVSLEDLRGEPNDWIVIYPKGVANDDFGQIVQWQYTGGNVDEVVTFNNIPNDGTYDIRVLYGVDRNTVVSKEIVVGEDNNGAETTLTTDKESYTSDQDIVVSLRGLRGENDDWIVIYPKGVANDDFGQIIQWQYTGGNVNETVTFDSIANGIYDIRVLYGQDRNTVVSKEIVVADEVIEVDIVARKNIYSPYELLYIDFINMSGAESGSIGIFALNAGVEKENAIELRSTNGVINGELSFNGLVAGDYEARVYFNDENQKTVAFTVQVEAVNRILYDDFEDGVIDPKWVRAAGPEMTILNVGARDGAVGDTLRQNQINGEHSLRTYRDYRGGLNYAGYYYNFQNFESLDKKLKFLEIDMKIGVSSHVFAFGVKVKTKFGDRRIEFTPWLNHTLLNGQQIIRGPYGNVLANHRQAFTNDNYLHVHPGPTDFYVATSSVGGGQNMFVHYKINIEEKLRILEPDNEFLGVTLFTTSGGDYDNLVLTTQ